MYKKIVLLIILFCLTFDSSHAYAEPAFKDLPANHWAYNDIITLAEKGVIGGYGDGTVRPNNYVTREELAKITFTLFPGTMDKLLQENINKPDYPDIYERWSSPYLKAATRLLPGYTDGLFKPLKPATRRDVAILLLYARLIQDDYYQLIDGQFNILLPAPQPETWNKMSEFKEYANLEKIYRKSPRYFEDDPDKKQFLKYAAQFFSNLNNIALLVEENIIRGYGDGSLRLKNPVTRAEACTLARRLLDLDLSQRKNFIAEPPALVATPNIITCDNNSAHAKMVNLGQWYKEKYSSLEERAKAIYNFLVFNFVYDWDYREGLSGFPPTSLEYTLATGTGTCTNFVNLYAVLAKYAGIKATVVTGKAKNPTDSGPHAWIELTVNGKVILVDPTYGVCTAKDYFNNFQSWEQQGYRWEEQSRKVI